MGEGIEELGGAGGEQGKWKELEGAGLEVGVKEQKGCAHEERTQTKSIPILNGLKEFELRTCPMWKLQLPPVLYAC